MTGEQMSYIPTSTSLEKLKKFKCIIVFLSFIVLLLVIALVITILTNIPLKTTCTTKECLQSASNLKLSLDTKHDPCEDFYQFACGKWDEHKIGHIDSELTNFVLINDRVDQVIHMLVKKPPDANDSAPIKMVKTFYQACNDKRTREKLGLQVMFKYLDEAGLPRVPTIFTLPPSKWGSFRFDWVSATVNLKKIFGIDLFIQYNVEENILNRDNVVLYLLTKPDDGKLPVLISQESLDVLDGLNVLEAFKKLLKPMVKHIILEVLQDESVVLNARILNNASDAIWNMTFEIPAASEVVGGGKEYENRIDELKKIKISELQNITNTLMADHKLKPLPESYYWQRHVDLLFHEIANISGPDEIYYFEKELPYILATPMYISKLPDVIVELYAWWKAVYAMIGSTTDDVVRNILSAIKLTEIDSFESDCVDLTIKHLNYAIAYGVITEEFMNGTKPDVIELFKNLKESLLERLKASDWIDEETKRTAFKKIHSLESQIGAPDWILNETAIMNVYKGLEFKKDTHLDNFIQLVKKDVKETFASYNADNKEAALEFFGTITDVNGYYKPLENIMIIPWALLIPPVYHLGLQSLNYGALGTIIGHEITHGFDNTGKQYDENAAYRLWWSEQSTKRYAEKSKCFENQYSNYKVELMGKSKYLNGQKTVNENIADNGGLSTAFEAYRKYLKDKGPEEVLPGFENYTGEQLFFLSYAHLWCKRNYSLSNVLFQTDEHSDNKNRVLGVLHNSQAFSDAFKCPVGSGMNPNRKRCTLW